MIYRADVIVLGGFNVLYLSDFGPLNHCRDFVPISNRVIIWKTSSLRRVIKFYYSQRGCDHFVWIYSYEFHVFVYVLHMQEMNFKMSVSVSRG